MNKYIIMDSIYSGFSDDVVWRTRSDPIDLETAFKTAHALKSIYERDGYHGRVKVVRVDA